jgi:aspartate-semialdehyde dehydrogenase
MTSSRQGYRVGVLGASSLLGQELLRVLKDRGFPASRLFTFEDEEDLELPVVDLAGKTEPVRADEELSPGDLDFLFLAGRASAASSGAAFLRRALQAAGRGGARGPLELSPWIIDLVEAIEETEAPAALRIPFLERAGRGGHPSPESRTLASPHPAAIVLSALLSRLATRFPLRSAVAQVFFPVSEIGPRGIEELQKQTVNLLSFQRIPQTVFGAQLAFNVLSRLPGKHAAGLEGFADRIRRELRQYLTESVPVPALQVCQVAVFYSLAFSLYVETEQAVSPEALAAALEGEHVQLRRRSEPAPSQVEAAGSGEILVDNVASDPEHPTGCWIWAAVDNIRLAAENAVEIAETLRERLQ